MLPLQTFLQSPSNACHAAIAIAIAIAIAMSSGFAEQLVLAPLGAQD
jgi:hypothetical protein